jgi:uncharacterized DUF497 family protein
VDIKEIIWLPAVEEKLTTKHGVSTNEVEEVFVNNPLITFVEKGRFQGEDVYAAWGRTHAGRYLRVFFIHKLSGDALVLSARDMDKKERRYYAKK